MIVCGGSVGTGPGRLNELFIEKADPASTKARTNIRIAIFIINFLQDLYFFRNCPRKLPIDYIRN
jgi:hypothetical protein